MSKKKEMDKDPLGNRMKEYERATKYILPRRSYIIIRVDGKAFHTYTKGFKRPFDARMIYAMNQTAEYLCKNIMGAQFAFTQSDEVSVVVTDFAKIATEPWFDNNVQKMCSSSAAMATAAFNREMYIAAINDMLISTKDGDFDGGEDFLKTVSSLKLAEFDSRVYQIPQRVEVMNYFIWRQQDTVRNSISSVSHSLYSQKELHGKNSAQQQELIFQKGTNWNDLDPALKRGRITRKVELDGRSKWVTEAAAEFTKEDGKAFFSVALKENKLEAAE